MGENHFAVTEQKFDLTGSNDGPHWSYIATGVAGLASTALALTSPLASMVQAIRGSGAKRQ